MKIFDKGELIGLLISTIFICALVFAHHYISTGGLWS